MKIYKRFYTPWEYRKLTYGWGGWILSIWFLRNNYFAAKTKITGIGLRWFGTNYEIF
jgi:hypothetical protein